MSRTDPMLPTALRLLATLLSVLPVASAVLCYFPLWVAEGGERLLPGIAVLLLAVAALPLYRLLRRALSSPGSWLLWLVAFIAFLLLREIADEMTVIAFVGFIGNLLGAVVFRIADRLSRKS